MMVVALRGRNCMLFFVMMMGVCAAAQVVNPAPAAAPASGPASAVVPAVPAPVKKSAPAPAAVPVAAPAMVPVQPTTAPVAAPAAAAVQMPAVAPVAAPAVTPVPAQVVQPVPVPVVQPQPVAIQPIAAPVVQAVQPAVAQPVVVPTAQVMPAAVKPVAASVAQPAAAPKKDKDELVGIDTVDLESPQGNWLFKRLWWERAEEKYEEIRSLQAHILELRMPFFMKRTDLSRTVLDPFYTHVAKDRGALEVLLGDISEFLAQEAQDELMLGDAQRELRDQLHAERDVLEQLQKNIQAVLSFDHELDAAIGTLMEQLNRVNEYEQEAWAHFKEIGRVLDDKKAREYVLKMKHIYRNIKEIEEYITQRFAIYFDQLIGTIKDHAQKVTATMDQLKEKGIDLKEQLAQVKEIVKHEHEEEQAEARKPKMDERGFFERYITGPLSSFFGTIWNGLVTVFSWPYNMIFGPEKRTSVTITEVEEAAAQEPEEEQQSE